MQALRGNPLFSFSVAERRAWALERRTTRKMRHTDYSAYSAFISRPFTEREIMHSCGLRRRLMNHQDFSSTKLSDSSQSQQEGKLSIEEQDCLRSLYPSGINCVSQNYENPKCILNTCLWTLETPKYLEWPDNNTKSLLLISADSGYRKSVLARYIIDEDLPSLYRTYPSKQVVEVIYCYLKDSSTAQRSASQAKVDIQSHINYSCLILA